MAFLCDEEYLTVCDELMADFHSLTVTALLMSCLLRIHDFFIVI